MSVTTSLEAVDLCIAGCKQIHEMVKKHFIDKPVNNNSDNIAT
jgi:hypothetical protein